MSARSDFKAASIGRKPKPAPFAIRLSPDERAVLERRAGEQPLGTYIRECALGSKARKRLPSRRRDADAQLLGRVLAALGQSRLSSNLNQIAKAANIGVLAVTPDLEADLHRACAEVHQMRADLIKALGLQDQGAQ
ncbi:MAG: hypothetical protein AAGH41_02785 [Pseudomonadota bacterium]